MNGEMNHEMNHSEPDVLALLAMGDTVPDADAQHVASCAACEQEITELRHVVHLARAGTPGGFADAPSRDVWSRISADLGIAGDVVPDSIRRADAAVVSTSDTGQGLASADPMTGSTAELAQSDHGTVAEPTHSDAGSAAELAQPDAESDVELAHPDDESAATPVIALDAMTPSEHTPAPAGRPALNAVPRASDSPPLTGSVRTGSMSAGTGERARRRRGASKRGRWISLVAAAAAVVIVGGIAITASLQRGPSVEVLAAAELGALPDWEGAAGDAVVELSDDGERNVVVTMASDGAVDGYREVWLISEDLSALVSVGVLEGENGRFVIPAGIDLEDYPIVDVSDEPLDGNPDHSGNSIVRGTLES